jgi:hypothetical protein
VWLHATNHDRCRQTRSTLGQRSRRQTLGVKRTIKKKLAGGESHIKEQPTHIAFVIYPWTAHPPPNLGGEKNNQNKVGWWRFTYQRTTNPNNSIYLPLDSSPAAAPFKTYFGLWGVTYQSTTNTSSFSSLPFFPCMAIKSEHK